MVAAPASISKLLGQSDWGEIDSETFLRELAWAIAGELQCARFGVRLVMDTPLGRTLKTVVMVDGSLNATVHVPDVIGDEVDEYLATVARCGGFIASHVEEEARIPSLLRDTLDQCDVRSLLDVSISLNGMIYGIMSCEHVGSAAQWSPHQVELLRRLAMKTAPTLIRVMNEQLTEPGALWEPGPSYWLAPLRSPPG